MPIYEFYCAACHLVSSFLSARVDTTTTPACPRCGGAGMTRRASPFAVSRGRKDEPPPSGTSEPGVDDERLSRAMESLAAELEGAGEGDPRRAAALMRKAYEAAGLPVTGRLEEAFRRMEAGEDPEAIEEEMGDVFDGDPFAAGTEAERAGRAPARTRRLRPPEHDPELYPL